MWTKITATKVSFVIMIGIVLGVGYGNYTTRPGPTDPASFYAAALKKGKHEISNNYQGWSYQFRAVAPTRFDIAAWEDANPDKTPYLMITACSSNFGEQDCDHYSVVNQPLHAGKEITDREKENYYWILQRAGHVYR